MSDQEKAENDLSGVVHSLIETAQASGLEPYWYLQYLFEQLPYVQSDKDLQTLLPTRSSPDIVQVVVARALTKNRAAGLPIVQDHSYKNPNFQGRRKIYTSCSFVSSLLDKISSCICDEHKRTGGCALAGEDCSLAGWLSAYIYQNDFRSRRISSCTDARCQPQVDA